MKNDNNDAIKGTRPTGFQGVPKRRYDDIETLEIDAVELFPETYDCGVIAISAYETAIGDGEDDDTDDPEDKLLFRIRAYSSENDEDATIDLSQEELKQLINGLEMVLACYGVSRAHPSTEEERAESYKQITNPPFDSQTQEAFENMLRDRNKRLKEEAEKNRPAWADISLEDFEAIVSSAWTTAHPLVEEAEMTGKTDRLLEVVREHWQEIEILNNAVQEFYEFSGSDADTWDSWTEPIAEAADELLDRIGAEFHEHH